LPNAAEFLQLVKKAAVEAVEATKPVKVYFGRVVCVEPLQIQVEQKLTIGESHLVLAQSLAAHRLSITGKRLSDDTSIGELEVTVQNRLVVGDMVLLIRMQGGQKYVVVDKTG
jgi:hypothetical protein